MDFFILLIFLLPHCALLVQIPYNWLNLAVLRASDYDYQPRDGWRGRQVYEALCKRLQGLTPNQQTLCQQHPAAIPFVARGVREALLQCQQQFQFDRWNCSSRDEVSEGPHGPFQDILGNTFRSTSREAAYLIAISSASIVHSITKGCTTGNLTECGCDSKPNLQKYAIEEDILGAQGPGRRQRANAEQFSWGGCSDNVPYGVKFARKFLDEWEQEEFERTKNVSHLVRKHNNFVGREAIAQNVRKQCRCHGVSGSCEFRTCWLQMPKFAEVAEMLKKRYEHFAVQVTKRAKKRLRRKDRTERQIPLRGNEMAYVQRSPSYCERNDTIGILGTSGRECRHGSYESDSCDLLCCGRGFNTRIETRVQQCHCKFVWCCEVKCEQCIEDVAVHTCK